METLLFSELLIRKHTPQGLVSSSTTLDICEPAANQAPLKAQGLGYIIRSYQDKTWFSVDTQPSLTVFGDLELALKNVPEETFLHIDGRTYRQREPYWSVNGSEIVLTDQPSGARWDERDWNKVMKVLINDWGEEESFPEAVIQFNPLKFFDQ